MNQKSIILLFIKSSETINYKEGTFIFALLSHFKSKFYIN